MPVVVVLPAVRVKYLVLQQVINGAVELIGARLGSHVYEAAAGPPEFRREGAGLYFELRDRIDADAEVPLIVSVKPAEWTSRPAPRQRSPFPRH